jgi:hypothetical protein
LAGGGEDEEKDEMGGWVAHAGGKVGEGDVGEKTREGDERDDGDGLGERVAIAEDGPKDQRGGENEKGKREGAEVGEVDDQGDGEDGEGEIEEPLGGINRREGRATEEMEVGKEKRDSECYQERNMGAGTQLGDERWKKKNHGEEGGEENAVVDVVGGEHLM